MVYIPSKHTPTEGLGKVSNHIWKLFGESLVQVHPHDQLKCEKTCLAKGQELKSENKVGPWKNA